MIHESKSAAKKREDLDIRYEVDEYLTLFVPPLGAIPRI